MEQVCIAQAARMLGLSQDTVRRRLRNGELTGEKVKSAGGFRWMVEVRDPGQDTTADDGTGETAALRDLINALQQQLDARTREISELHQLLGAKALNPTPHHWWQFWLH